MGSPIKVALLLLLGARATATNKTFRAVIFKEARTGSTWLADLLRNERSVGYFAHEASSCVKNGDGALQRQALFSLLAAPACDMRCGVQARDAARLRWLADERRPAPPCFAGKLVGFDIQAKNDLGEDRSPPLDWAADWKRLLRLPDVRAVVFARTNVVKRCVSKAHVDVFYAHCRTRKAVSADHRACLAAHRAAIDAPVAVDGADLARLAHNEGREWVDLMEKAGAAGGRPPLLVFYEALLRDPHRELKRFFAALGMGDRAVSAASGSLKITGDDLRKSVANFSGVEAALGAADPCFLGQLRDAESRVFDTICLAGGTSAFSKHGDASPTAYGY